MLRRFRNACPEARLRLVVGVALVLTAAAMGYADRNPDQVGPTKPGQIVTLSAQTKNCGQVSIVTSGGGCGSTRKMGGVTFLSATK